MHKARFQNVKFKSWEVSKLTGLSEDYENYEDCLGDLGSSHMFLLAMACLSLLCDNCDKHGLG